MSQPKHSVAGLLEGSSAILTAVGGAIRGMPGRLAVSIVVDPLHLDNSLPVGFVDNVAVKGVYG